MMKIRRLGSVTAVLTALLAAITACTTTIQPTGEPTNQAASRPTVEPERPSPTLPDLGQAPEIRNDVWVNTDRPVTLADSRGKVVLLEFWTFG